MNCIITIVIITRSNTFGDTYKYTCNAGEFHYESQSNQDSNHIAKWDTGISSSGLSQRATKLPSPE